jgi:YegS/Rv2252/BmrU family lipid kinase
MRATVIINPNSGRQGRRAAETAEARVGLARRLLARGEFGASPEDVDIQLTRQRGHGADLAASAVARGLDVVVAWGGDGTINEVAGPLIGSRTALGIVPAGSGDGFARGLGLPRDGSQALRLALAAPTGAIDTGTLGSRHFLNIGGIGFDAAVAQAFDRRPRRGLTSYFLSVFREVWTYRPERYGIEFDDGATMDGRYQMLAFANCREYGNRLVLEPDADPRDGRLNAVLVDDGPAWRQLLRSRRLVFASAKPVEGVARRTATMAVVTAGRLLCHVDGEPFETSGRLEVGIRPKALLVKGVA